MSNKQRVLLHKIYVRHSGIDVADLLPLTLIRRCIWKTLYYEGAKFPCEVSVLITDDDGIRKINRRFRGVDSSTDVLSFPMQEFSPPGWNTEQIEGIDPETGVVPLGDIILSFERTDVQARENGHTRELEASYLIVHSVMHLLGYDHMDEAEEKRQMRDREKEIMQKL